MRPFHLLGGALAAGCIALLLASPAAATSPTQQAEDVRKLDIMLMVSSLRCRHGDDNFQADYQRFSARHLSTLNRAYRTLHGNLSRIHGTKGAKRKLDRISVGMANQYGQGHPWLNCAELKTLTSELADRPAGEDLHPTALALLGDRASGRTYLAARQ